MRKKRSNSCFPRLSLPAVFLLILIPAVLLVPSCSAGGASQAESSPRGDGWETVKPRLTGLGFDEFLDASFRELALRTPEFVTELGLDAPYGLDGNELNDFSEKYIIATEEIHRGLLTLLQTYSPEDLDADGKISREVFRWYLEDLIRGQEFRHNSFPVSHFVVAEPATTELFFTDVQPVSTEREAENYLTRLEQVGEKMEQLARQMELREQEGILLPSLSIRWTLGNLSKISQSPADRIPYFTAFKEKLSSLNLPETRKEELLERARRACTDSVIPGYRRLEEVLYRQASLTDETKGAGSLPNGDAYYKYSLSHFTTTDYTPEDIHRRGYSELERIHQEMRKQFAALGIDTSGSVARMYQELDRTGEKVAASKMVETYTEYVAQAQEKSAPYFNRSPRAEVIVKGDVNGGFYVPGNLDGSRSGIFFARNTQGDLRYKMPTLTFHETVPGHHFQIALANESKISPFQKGSNFLGFVEGWALYAERLMADAGFYEDDPVGDLGRLQAEAFRATRLVVDTGIHHYGWDFNRAVDFFVENTGFPQGYAQWEILRYTVWPGQATAYMTGMLKILELREEAAAKGMDLPAFHEVLLRQGAVPLELLDRILEEAR